MEGLEEDEEITADIHTYIQRNTHNSHSLSQPVPSGYGLRENYFETPHPTFPGCHVTLTDAPNHTSQKHQDSETEIGG